jgi:ATP-dependent Clp protease adapter protein ClpS
MSEFLILSQINPIEQEETEVIDQQNLVIPAHVILFNDDWHSFDEVILQLIKAIHCTFDEAEAYALQVHNKGKAIVFEGELTECLRVSSVLEEIALHTQIEY